MVHDKILKWFFYILMQISFYRISVNKTTFITYLFLDYYISGAPSNQKLLVETHNDYFILHFVLSLIHSFTFVWINNNY